MGCGTVIVIGNSGVGKSTLINAVLGEEVAPTSFGIKGTSQELAIYKNDNIPFNIVDTVGFEPSFFKERKAINAVRKWSKESIKQGDEDAQINAIWFCVDGTASKLFPKAIQNLSRATSMWPSLPVIVVITKSYSVPDRDDNIKMVDIAFKKQKKYVQNLKAVLPVVASVFYLNDFAYAPPEGITELIAKTNELLPEGKRAAQKDISDFILKRKRVLSQTVVGTATISAAVVGAVPIPIPDATILVPVEVCEINGVARIYGIKKTKEAIPFFDAIVQAGTVSVAAKSAINVLKAIPGVNLGAAVLNAIVGASIVAALGECSIYAFEQVYLGKKTVKDIDWVAKCIESKLSGSFIEKVKLILEKTSEDMSREKIAKVIMESFFVKNN